jgi:hydroxymethylpyrimidine pyrophosphatase-like HAD family hydrolase
MSILNKANNIENFLPYSLIAMDMDGTLLTSDKKILPETLADLSWVADKGA